MRGPHLTQDKMRIISRMSRGFSSKSNFAVWICLAEEGPYRMRDLIRIFRSDSKEMSRVVRYLEDNDLIWSGMKGKTRWYGVTEGSVLFINAMYRAILG
jgi:DNA-binding MarR family transcriptional regulator